MTAKAEWPDYVVFCVIMLISLGTGIYFSFGQKTTEIYLYGNRQMSVFPVSTSLVVSFISAITMQGVPAEVFVYGIQYLLMEVSIAGMWVAAFTFVPLYYPLNLTSVYEYLGMRFGSRPVVILAYVLGLLTANLYMGIIIYAPATALESIVHTPTWLNIVLISITSTIYTAIGGMKAVVWNDTFQALVMVAGLVTVIITGAVKVGGFGEVWHELETRGRTNVDYLPDPTLRITFWYGLLSIFSSAGLYSTQPALMRFNAVSSMDKAKQILYIGSIGKLLITALAAIAGAVVLAYYSKLGCEPMATGAIDSPNQILPYFLVDALGMPGIPGLFIASIVAASLSTMSSVQNAMAAVVWKEILSPFIKNITDAKETFYLKMIVVFFGAISTVIAFGAKYIGGTLIQIAMLVLSVTDIPPIALFFIGAMFTFTSGAAAFIACICCLGLYMTLELGRFFTNTDWPTPPLINENCPSVISTNMSYSNLSSINSTSSAMFNDTDATSFSYLNLTTITPDTMSVLSNDTLPWTIFRLSPYLYGTVGLAFTIIVAVLLSLIPCLRNRKPVAAKLLFPFVRRFAGHTDPDTLLDDLILNIETEYNTEGEGLKKDTDKDPDQDADDVDIVENCDNDCILGDRGPTLTITGSFI